MKQMRITTKPKQPKSFQFVAVKNARKGAKARRKGQHTGKKIFLTTLGVLFAIFVIVGIVGAIAITGYIGAINASLPNAGDTISRDLEESTKIFDRNGKLLYTVYGDYNREYVTIDKIPDHTKWALLSAEDDEFYEHRGIDLPGIISSLLDYVKTGARSVRGASTITQQLSRIAVLYDLLGDEIYEVSYTRKIKEILVAFQLENKLSKDEILELYMNEVSLGGTIYGYQTASKAYFNKNVEDLTLAESALLAVVIRAPTAYSNDLFNGETEEVKKYRDIVLDLMLQKKDKTGVTAEEVKAAKEEEINITPGQINITAPHFVFYVIEKLEAQFGAEAVRNGGLRVYTTLDLPTQKIAEAELKKHISYSNKVYGVYNGAVVIINPKNGETLAMVGSVDYNKTKDKRIDGNVNVAVMPRQMGSSVKPYTYLAAITKGFNPGTVSPDIPMTFGGYKPENWNFKYDGLLTMRRALNQSRNLPAVYTLQMIGGTDVFIDTAEKLGITTLTQRDRYGLSLTLGAGDMRLIEHTNAFAVFANEGVRHDISTIKKIENAKGEELFQSDPKKTAKRVFKEEEVYLLNWMMCMIDGDQDKHVPNYYYAAGQKLCGKTGTTNGPKDLLTLLYYPKLAVGVWAGNNNGAITIGQRQGWSENVPIVIANRIMTKLVPKYGKEFYTQPSGVTFTTVCIDTGLVATADTDCKKFRTPIIRGAGPAKDEAHKKLPICSKTGKVASNEEEAKAAGLVKYKLYLDFELQNPSQQTAYNKYVTSKLKYGLWEKQPASEPCIPDIGLTFITPEEEQEFNRGENINASVQITSVNALATVVFTFADTTYTGVFDSGSNTYKCTSCKVPSGAEAGLMPVSIEVTDVNGNTATSTRNINVVIVTPTPTPTPSATPIGTIVPLSSKEN